MSWDNVVTRELHLAPYTTGKAGDVAMKRSWDIPNTTAAGVKVKGARGGRDREILGRLKPSWMAAVLRAGTDNWVTFRH